MDTDEGKGKMDPGRVPAGRLTFLHVFLPLTSNGTPPTRVLLRHAH